MTKQLKPIVELLKKTDGIAVPRVEKSFSVLQNGEFVSLASLQPPTANGEDMAINTGSHLSGIKTAVVVDIEQDDLSKQNGFSGFTPHLGTARAQHGNAAMVEKKKDLDSKALPPWMVSRWKKEQMLRQVSPKEEPEEPSAAGEERDAGWKKALLNDGGAKIDDSAMQALYIKRYVEALCRQIGGNETSDNTNDKMETENTTDDAGEEDEMQIDEEDLAVSVGDRSVPLTQVTEEDKEMMTTEEYEGYYETYFRFVKGLNEYYTQKFLAKNDYVRNGFIEVKPTPHTQNPLSPPFSPSTFMPSSTGAKRGSHAFRLITTSFSLPPQPSSSSSSS